MQTVDPVVLPSLASRHALGKNDGIDRLHYAPERCFGQARKHRTAQ